MQFKVPQFLDIEDKIFGPFTFREFVYLAGGAGLCFILYKLLGLVFGAVPILIIGGFSLALTFYKPNNKPFINMIESSLKYFTQNKLYIWKKSASKIMNDQLPARNAFGIADVGGRITNPNTNQIRMAHSNNSELTGSKLRDLAWSLDVLDLSKHKN